MLKRKKSRLISLLIVLLLVVGAGAVYMQMQPTDEALAAEENTDGEVAEAEAEDEEPAVPVELAVAIQRDLPSYFNSTGSLLARRNVDLISKAQGQVTRLLVEEGDFVKKGEILIEIDHRQEALLLEQSKVRAQTAQLEMERVQNMSTQGLVTDREFEEKKQNAEVAEFERDLSQVKLEDKIVRAPFDGQITTRLVELGQTVNLGVPLVGIADVFPLEIRLYLPEKVVQELSIGQPVEIRPDVGGGEALAGIVERIAPVVDAATSTVKVTLRVDEPGSTVRVGSFVRARITTDVHEGVVAIPKKAVVSEAGASFLFVADADSVRKIGIETGYADDEYIEILEGLSRGERVVVVGQGGLRQGSKIRDLNAVAAEEDESGANDSGDDDEAKLASAGGA